ncbi:MAG TPA: DVUA0089 family protein [Phycisphaerales bacterium]|nr:DVUA0089 family protein [Phycisphaerales bacterium]
MTLNVSLMVVTALMACAGLGVHRAGAQVFTRSSSLNIPDTPTVTDTLVVSGGPAAITDVNVTITLSHADLSQLDILLIPPGGSQYLVLCADAASIPGTLDHTRFDDAACGGLYTGTAPFHASFRPKGGIVIPYLGTIPPPPQWMTSLAALNGTDANGPWTLLIDDDTDGGTGVLQSWSLEFNDAIDPAGPADLWKLCATGTVVPSVSRHGHNVTVRVAVTPRSNPTSTGITVFAMPDTLGVPVLELRDDGLSDDGAAGDNVFGGAFIVPATAPLGVAPINFLVQDAQSRFGTGSVNVDIAPDSAWFESKDGGGDAGDLPPTAQPVLAAGRTQIRGRLDTPTDVDMYAISICSPSVFRVSTEQVTTFDTQVFLFTPDGHGVVMNDDAFASYQSTITSTFVTQPGDYMLAISRYDFDPIDAGFSEIWDDANYIFEQPPDGPGAPNPVAGWWGLTFNPVGPYTITLESVEPQGTCATSQCDSIDFNNDGLFPDTSDIDDMLSVFSGGFCSNDPDCGDIDFNNDGLFPDVSDIAVFLQVFSGGPCAW